MSVLDEQGRVKISWSSLSRWELCKQKQYLIAEGLSIPGKNVRNFLAGNIVDSVQKTWLENPKGAMVDLVEEHMQKAVTKAEENDTIKWRNKNDKRNILNSSIDAATNLEPILRARVLPYDYEVGKWFNQPVSIRDQNTGEIREILLRGEIDLLVKEDDSKFVIWDLKTTANNDYWKKSLGQLVFYDLVIMAMFGEYAKKAGFIQPLCEEQVKEFYFDNTHRTQIWGKISTFAHAEWAGDHAPKKDNTGCTFCEVFHACVKFKKRKLFT